MPRSTPLDDFFRGLRDSVPQDDVTVSGAWSSEIRRQSTAEGTCIDVLDWHWNGTCHADTPLAGLALFGRERQFRWAKSARPAMDAPIGVSVLPGEGATVTFSASFHGTYLPTFATEPAGELPAACAIGDGAVTLGVAHVLAELAGITFAVLLLPQEVIKVGRSRLWRVRDEVASRLEPALGQLLTRSRTGILELPVKR